MSDQDIIEKLQSKNAEERESVFVFLYQLLFDQTVAYILNNKGTKEEAQDIFQDSLLVFYKLVRQNKLSTISKIKGYIFSISRNLWLKKLQKKKREIRLNGEEFDIPMEGMQLDNLITAEQQELFDKVLKSLGPDCKAILTAFYYDQLRMDEICKLLKYSNVQVAKNKKYKCMKKLKQLILNTDYFRQLFEKIRHQ